MDLISEILHTRSTHAPRLAVPVKTEGWGERVYLDQRLISILKYRFIPIWSEFATFCGATVDGLRGVKVTITRETLSDCDGDIFLDLLFGEILQLNQ